MIENTEFLNKPILKFVLLCETSKFQTDYMNQLQIRLHKTKLTPSLRSAVG